MDFVENSAPKQVTCCGSRDVCVYLILGVTAGRRSSMVLDDVHQAAGASLLLFAYSLLVSEYALHRSLTSLSLQRLSQSAFPSSLLF